MPRERIAIVDVQAGRSEECRRILTEAGYRCTAITGGADIDTPLRAEPPDLMLAGLGDDCGKRLAHLRKTLGPGGDVPLIALLSPTEACRGPELLRQGAFDFLPWPGAAAHLTATVERALGYHRLKVENRRLRLELQNTLGCSAIAGQSAAMQPVLDLIRRSAETEANIVISGEAGTGKSLAARIIHRFSKRRNGPLVVVDCGLRPEDRLDLELFGCEAGVIARTPQGGPGLIEAADGGTLCLEDADQLPSTLQVKLLRVLHEHETSRLGAAEPTAVSIRTITTVRHELAARVRQSRFREDLYYRLNVIAIHLPPLRERAGDIAMLAYAFLRETDRDFDFQARGYTPAALAALEAYGWPGNAGELKRVVGHARAAAGAGAITPAHLPEDIRSAHLEMTDPGCDELRYPTPPPAGTDTLALTRAPLKDAKDLWLNNFEQAYVKALIRQHEGNVSQAARSAGIDRKTLYRLLKKHRLR